MEMTTDQIAHPKIATEEEWRKARIELLEEEKALTKEYDRLNAKRRRLPMVRVPKQYSFHGTEGDRTLLDLFEGRRQLIVYHFMFAPEWETGCSGCTSYIDALGDLSMLAERDTSFVLISRAPLEKLQKYKAERGWDHKWLSSQDSDFNYDFKVTLDPNRGLTEYNYRDEPKRAGEWPGTSVFFRIGDEIYHTYSTFARGGESLCDTYRLLDITPYGRQEDFEDSPEGWPQRPTYG
jgi:predicted dithiol-disulfide oxidoreductase (DUF899 family)